MARTPSQPPTPSRLASKIAIPPTPDAPTEPAGALPPTPADRWDTSAFLNATAEPNAHAHHTEDEHLAETFRHSGWLPVRRKVHEAMKAIPAVSDRRRFAFCNCGHDAYIEIGTSKNTGAPTDVRIKSTKCHDRFCIPCARERSARIQTNLLAYMHGKERLSLITLTIKQSDDPLKTTLDRITRHFRALRSLPIWKKNVEGGTAIIETKIGSDGKSWNVHFHIIAQSRYLNQDALSTAWNKLTGDSYIVDVRRVGTIGGAAKYITKYVSKAQDASITRSPKHLQEAIIAFTGRRLVTTFGTWRGLQLSETPDELKSTDGEWTAWTTLGTIGHVLRAAQTGDPVALFAAKFIHKRGYIGDP